MNNSRATARLRPPLTNSRRSMWFIPKPSTLKSKLQRTLINAFHLAPLPPSVNLEEFALMSKLFQVIVDCRTEEQREEGRIPKSIHVPLSSMTEENRENMSIQFSQLTVLVYDQNSTIVDTAASYLRDCGAEAWSLEGGADAFRDFVAQTRNGTYTRRVTLEEAQQHIHAQSRAGGRLPRKYDPNRVIEQFEESDGADEGSLSPTKNHTISIRPSEYNRQQHPIGATDEAAVPNSHHHHHHQTPEQITQQNIEIATRQKIDV